MRKEHSLRVSENRVLREIFGHNRTCERIEEEYITKTFMICTPHQILFRWSIKENEMGGACGTYGGQERCVQGFGKET